MQSPLVQWRKGLGLTQQELGLLAGVSATKISEVENGIRPLGKALEDFLRHVGDEAIIIIDQHEVFRERIKDQLRQNFQARVTH